MHFLSVVRHDRKLTQIFCHERVADYSRSDHGFMSRRITIGWPTRECVGGRIAWRIGQLDGAAINRMLQRSQSQLGEILFDAFICAHENIIKDWP